MVRDGEQKERENTDFSKGRESPYTYPNITLESLVFLFFKLSTLLKGSVIDVSTVLVLIYCSCIK